MSNLTKSVDLTEMEKTIKNSICPTATTNEISLFIQTARSLNLNPLVGEIYCIKPKTKDGKEKAAQIFIGWRGYMNIANRSGELDSIISGAIYENDQFTQELEKPIHKYSFSNRGKLVAAYCYVYKKDSKYPFSQVLIFDENLQKKTSEDASFSAWKTNTAQMLVKSVECATIKRAFEIVGVGEPEFETDVETLEISDVQNNEYFNESTGEVITDNEIISFMNNNYKGKELLKFQSMFEKAKNENRVFDFWLYLTNQQN